MSQESLNKIPKPQNIEWRDDIFIAIRNSAGIWIAVQFAFVGMLVHLWKLDETSADHFIIPSFMMLLFSYMLVPWFKNHMGKFFLPLLIILMLLGPSLAAYIILFENRAEARFLEFARVSRAMPLLLASVVLIAWYYRFVWVLVFALALFVLDYLAYWVFNIPLFTNKHNFVVLMEVRIGSLIVVGYMISRISGYVRQQAEQLVEAHRQVMNYSDTLEELSVNKERNRMARELHDTLAHSLTALTVQLEATKAYLDVNTEQAKDNLQKCLDTARSGLKETRFALQSLRSNQIIEQGLLGSIRQALDNIQDYEFQLRLPDTSTLIPDALQHILYRIFLESLHNIQKHSQASQIKVKLISDADFVQLEVHDNGIGFNPNQKTQAGQLGLLGMKERVALAGGTLLIKSKEGQGTTIVSKFKLENTKS